jgi:DNA-binding IclR family transcriptional regulator
MAGQGGDVSGGRIEPGRTVTSKVLAVLDAFARGDAHLTLTELSQATALPTATVHRLAAELVSWGGLERRPDRTYRIGVRLWEIGSLAPQRTGLREIAIPFMEDLYEATHENVQLAVLDGYDALCVEKISGRQSVPIVTRVGGRLPLHATGVGKALLAFASPAFIEEVIDRGLPALTHRTIVQPDELRRCLEEARRAGFAHTRDEMTLGSVSVAAPVFGPHATVVAALSLVVRSHLADIRRLAPPVRTAALGCSRRVTEAWDGILPEVDAAPASTEWNTR